MTRRVLFFFFCCFFSFLFFWSGSSLLFLFSTFFFRLNNFLFLPTSKKRERNEKKIPVNSIKFSSEPSHHRCNSIKADCFAVVNSIKTLFVPSFTAVLQIHSTPRTFYRVLIFTEFYLVLPSFTVLPIVTDFFRFLLVLPSFT